MKKYDICIIGGGPSGYAAAMRAVDFGKKTLLIEKNRLGGAAVFNGALSSKTLWEISTEYYEFRNFAETRLLQSGAASTGLSGKLKPDFDWVQKSMNDTLAIKEKQLMKQVEALEMMKGENFAFIQGTGELEDKNTVKITKEDGTTELIQTEYIILATGSRPRMLTNIPVDEKIICTSNGIHAMKGFPKSIVIVGAGVIGCEFATILGNFGCTHVNLIDKEERILPFEDDDVAQVVIKNFEELGVNIHHNASLDKLEVIDGKVVYSLKYKDGSRSKHEVEKALLSIGRVPNAEGLGLDKTGIKCKPNGHIDDSDTQTSVPNIYAVGDLTADIALVNVGELEGRHAVEKIYGNNKRSLSYSNISTIMFLNPEIAAVGMNEKQARTAGINYRVASYHYSYISRALAKRNTNGFFKILVSDDDEMKVLGMRALGMHSSSAMAAVSLLISTHSGIDTLTELIQPHPSIPEGIQECVRMLKHNSVLKPEVFKTGMRCSRVVNGVAVEF